MINPADVLNEVERLAGATAPEDVRLAAEAANVLTRKIDELEAIPVPPARDFAEAAATGADMDEIAAARQAAVANDRTLRELRHQRGQALLNGGVALQRHGDRLIELLQPRHREIVDTIDGVDDEFPGLAAVGHDAAVDLDAVRLEAWRKRRDAARTLRDIEVLVAQHLHPNQRAWQSVDERGTGHWIEAGEVETWWSNFTVPLLERFSGALSPLGSAKGVRPPDWPECRASGAKRVLRTSTEMRAAAILSHNLIAAASAKRNAHGQPLVTRIVA